MIPVRDIPFDSERLASWTWHRTPSPEQSARDEVVRRVLDTLPRMQVDIINAVFFEKVPKREVARRIGISRTTVQRHINKVAKRLEEALGAAV